MEELTHGGAFSTNRDHDLCGASENPCHLARVATESFGLQVIVLVA